MSTTDAEFQRNFRLVVERIFNNWQDLRLAVEHGMGGRNGQQLAIQVMDYTYQYCSGNDNITPGELQDVIEDLMDQEFNTICDDASIPQICSNLLRYKQMALQGQYAQIEEELSKVPHGKDWLNPNVKITYTPIDGESSSSEDDDSDGSGDGDGMDVDGSDDEKAEQASCSRVTRSQARKKQQDDFVEPDPGWTTVRGRRK